jgi:hypothetical protein
MNFKLILNGAIAIKRERMKAASQLIATSFESEQKRPKEIENFGEFITFE